MDNVSFDRLNLLHPAIKDDAIKAYKEAILATPTGVHPIITQTLRTFEEQAVLYAQGRTIAGKVVTNSKPGQSYHQYGLALDFVIRVGGKIIWEVDNNWMIVVNCFQENGFFWGGEFKKFKDYPHFEKTVGFHWSDLLILHDKKDFIPGTEYIDLA